MIIVLSIVIVAVTIQIGGARDDTYHARGIDVLVRGKCGCMHRFTERFCIRVGNLETRKL